MSNTFKKTNRKNKTNLTVNWLTSFFTVEDLHAANPNFIMITLRSRLMAAKKENHIAEIGYMHSGKGRPKLVFAQTPVTQEVLDSARKAGVIFNDTYNSIAVVDVNSVELDIEKEASLAEDESMESMSEDKMNV